MRHIRTVLAVLLFLATLCLALVAALSFWITPERVSARLASALETHLGLRAELSGELALKRLPELEITVPRGALKSAATGEARGEFAAAVIRMKPWAIFANSPRVDEVLIDGLELSVSAASAAEAAGGATSSKAFWNISLVDLRNGSLALEPGVLGDAAVSLEALEARLENLDETGGTVRLAANLKADPASGALTLAGLFRFLPGAGPLPERLSIESASASLDGLWSGRSLHAEGATASVAPSAGGWSLAGARLSATFAKGGSWSFCAESARLTRTGLESDRIGFTARTPVAAGELSAEGSARTSWIFEPGAVSLSAIELSTRLERPGVSAASAADRLTGRIMLSSLGDADVELSGSFAGASLAAKLRSDDAVEGDAPLRLSGEVRLGALDPALAASIRLPDALLGRVAFEGDVSVDSLGPALGLSGLSARAQLRDGALTLAEGRAAWLRGDANFTAHLSPEGAWRASVRVRGASAGEWFAGLGRPAALTGRADGAIELAGSLRPEVGEAPLSQAEGSFVIRDGAFSGLDVPAAFRILVEDMPAAIPPEVRKPDASTPFAELGFRTELRGGRLVIARGRATGPAEGGAPLWTADFEGGLAAGALAIKTTLRLPAREKLPEIPLAAEVRTDASLAPAWQVAWKEALEVVEAARSGEPMTLDALGRRVERAIRDFWQGLELPKIELPKMPWQSEDKPAEPAQPAV